MLLTPALAIVVLQGTTPAVMQPALNARDPQEIVCKTAAKTNTRFGKRTCRTRAEWDAISEQARRDAQETFDKVSFDSRRSD